MIKRIKRFLRARGIEITRYVPDRSNDALLKKCTDFFDIDLLIDVGANKGQYGMIQRESGYKGTIISFEPLKEAFRNLTFTAGKYDKWEVHNYGVGSKNEDIEINISKNIESSSILNVTNLSVDAEPLSGFSSKEKIRIVTLDSFLMDKAKQYKNIFLKVDVQGFEVEVLKGAKQLLSEAKVVQLEMSFVPLYENGPLFSDILNFMGSAGFEIYTIIPDFRNPVSGRMLQADGIFIRKGKV